ncbi:Alpha/beta hydrolase family domain-containing protein [Rozella allomycis CSF55]|uniref:Alpha/beta hydrolase family domain-containing protein n=1 Tax=Rozella allomycis (strain CSF55) TaxID=988480 RepID=A0A075B458_ROZAC|nr:Alpha/beta hydrolase family domain-containing protein [Rozella allomycis CSF55]|eukprot:EPZ36040.1 Alpha/beta hydrolase family domain-containing protein [Rozella allomycis CSF55]
MTSGTTAQNKNVFNYLSQVYWPTSVTVGKNAEENLLNYGGLEPFPSKIAKSYKVLLSKEIHIHTLSVDHANGVGDIILDDASTFVDMKSNNDDIIVLCHGYATGLGYYYKNFKSISEKTGRRVLAFDWLGMGRSSRPKFPFNKFKTIQDTEKTIDYFIESLEEWRKCHRLRNKMILIGHSMGGYLSAWYALKYPENVKKLILVSPVGLPDRPDDVKKTQLSEADVSNLKEFDRPKPPSYMRRFFYYLWDQNYTPQWLVRTTGPLGRRLVKLYTTRRFSLDPDEAKNIDEYFYHLCASKGSGEYALGLLLAPGAYARKPLLHHLKDIQVPIHFMCNIFTAMMLDGEEDWMDSSHAAEAQKTLKYKSQLIHISDAGHHLYLDNAEEFNDKLVQLIQRIDE